MLKNTLFHYFMILCFENITVCAELLLCPSYMSTKKLLCSINFKLFEPKILRLVIVGSRHLCTYTCIQLIK